MVRVEPLELLALLLRQPNIQQPFDTRGPPIQEIPGHWPLPGRAYLGLVLFGSLLEVLRRRRSCLDACVGRLVRNAPTLLCGFLHLGQVPGRLRALLRRGLGRNGRKLWRCPGHKSESDTGGDDKHSRSSDHQSALTAWLLALLLRLLEGLVRHRQTVPICLAVDGGQRFGDRRSRPWPTRFRSL